MLSLQRVAKRFGSRIVFDGVSLEVGAGEYVAIVGDSGIGKSTLLNVIAGLEPVDSGTILFQGKNLVSLCDDELTLLRRDHFGFVFQAFHVLPYLPVGENVALPLALNGVRDAAADPRVAALLDAVGLGDRAASPPRELSGGELQRVAIARALVHAPAVVLADEPTDNLDPRTAASIVALLRDTVKRLNATAVIVTHSRAAASAADRVLELRPDGLVRLQG